MNQIKRRMIAGGFDLLPGAPHNVQGHLRNIRRNNIDTGIHRRQFHCRPGIDDYIAVKNAFIFSGFNRD
ncbi:hypothetical protein, partial [Staphylococcus aureus]|uniref:hypothetical protein n=1 Tax=Staphylococcus aureus TaxID=1280 RepID=UPI001FD36FDD